VTDALGIYNTLMRHAARIVVDIDGMAASSASLVAMAGDKIRMAEDALLMIHDPWSPRGGTAAELRQAADTLDKVESTVRSIYAKRTGLSDDEVDVMMASETWMTADEAVSNRFADEVTRALRVAAKVDPERYKHVPRRLLPEKESTIAAYKKRVAELKT
jgi:ATP-dependent Clp protease protease subunit